MTIHRRTLLMCALVLGQGAGCARETPLVSKTQVDASALPATRSLSRESAEAAPTGARRFTAPPTSYAPPTPLVAPAQATHDDLAANRTAEPAKREKDAPEAEAKAALGAGGSGRMAREVMAASRPMPASANVGAQALVQAPAAPPADMNTEAYAHIAENGFSLVRDSPLSTFSVDVDTASYSNVRRFLVGGSLPPAEAVRVEELINYFHYAYPEPRADEPFASYAEVGPCPWNENSRLVHIGVKTRDIADAAVPPRNLVFLLDVSGSMQDANKLPLLKRGLALLTERLRPQDHVAIVVYAGSSGLALPPTSGRDRAKILAALDHLEAGGSTNGAEGIELAYRVAESQFDKAGINRVILATDGDFNVGVTSEGALVHLIEQKRKTGVYLTVLGFGSGNLQDARMEQLADKGNGNYAYIDDIAEAQKVLVREAGSTLVTVAKDVKLQVEWNPEQVASYRLVGYENRALAARDFNDDSKDAGEIGAGHTVTALYEVVPRAAANNPSPEVDALRYQKDRTVAAPALSDELFTVKIRYKAPTSDVSKLIARSLHEADTHTPRSSTTFRFSAAVAGFGLLLRHSQYVHGLTLAKVRELAGSALEGDTHGDKAQFLELVRTAERLSAGG